MSGGTTGERATGAGARTTESVPTLVCPRAAGGALATPDERGWVRIPAANHGSQPVHDLGSAVWLLPYQRPPYQDALHRLGHIQPRATDRGVQGKDALSQTPIDYRRRVVPGQVVPDEQHTDGRQLCIEAKGVIAPAPITPTAAGRRGVGTGWTGRENGGQLPLEPGVEHCIGRCGYGFATYFSRGRSKQRQQLGRPGPEVFVRLPRRASLRLPGGAGLGDGLIGPSLVLAPNLEPQHFAQPVRAFNQVFLGVASGSVTVRTVPSLRFRWAVPVAHQVRFCWKV
jgi:hypothetical protein